MRKVPARELGIDARALAPWLARVGPVAVADLETTGLSDDPAAEILEVGVALLDPGEEQVRTFETLVRPTQPLPRVIQRLTGLRDEDVAHAPRLQDVAPALRSLLAGRRIVAHNAEFERHFLVRDVDPELASADWLDTQDVLALAYPDAPDLRLETFTRMLLGTEERHRALADALDAARVLSRVAERAQRGERRFAAAHEALARYAPESPWLALLEPAPARTAAPGAAEAGPPKGMPVRGGARGPDTGPEQGEAADAPGAAPYVRVGESREAPVPFDADAIAAALRDEARGRRHFPGYRVREAQVRLARHFVETLRDGRVSLVEGGTGVGKSLAYLAAAIPFARERAAVGDETPVVVSTRTRLLQDQLLEKDIPAAARMLGHPELRALSIKGRANYACRRRLDAVLAEGDEPRIFAEDRMAYALLAASVAIRPHGELGSVPPAWLRRHPHLAGLLRRSVAARAELCSREQCASQPDCPLGRRRGALAGADLVVANHDLLLRWPADYPPIHHAIVDEAHELADVADEVYAQEVTPEAILERLEEIFGRPDAQRRGGDALLPATRRRALRRDAVAWRRELHQELRALGQALSPAATDWGDVQLPARPGPRFSDAAGHAERIASRLAGIAEHLARVAPDAREGTTALARALAELREMGATLRLAFAGVGDEAVAAFERIQPPWDRWRLVVRTVSPADPFHEQLLGTLESFAGVSASLFVGGDAFAALGDLEIVERTPDPPGVLRVTEPSPFPYAEHMRVVALDAREDLVEETTEVLAHLARRLGGRTLGLFTSVKRMHEVAERLSERLRTDGIEVIAPRRAGDDPAALVERFCNGGSVLLGARRFWQGLDVPGADLQAVVIEKLPFEVPTELRRRREERLKRAGVDAFGRYTLGRMLLNLKQMVGRLVRTEEDRGLVVIVESRRDRRYFARLRDALPPGCPLVEAEREDLDRLMDEVGIGEEPA